ncbi:hypothetical protein AVEN_136595-1 [Araneus ventricosus]|uniref:Uncharacterized protein n=1 Tax=Araneus ventricosus TaxID=182803 RepID=A0A4Y2RZS9_ARAVE|nr:hypothetical protein AVEN_136595-1 [Araneus ventricosus]
MSIFQIFPPFGIAEVSRRAVSERPRATIAQDDLYLIYKQDTIEKKKQGPKWAPKGRSRKALNQATWGGAKGTNKVRSSSPKRPMQRCGSSSFRYRRT